MTRREILAEAEKCVCGDREQDYGSPEDNFKAIAELWQVYRKATLQLCQRRSSHDGAAQNRTNRNGRKQR